MAYPILSIFRIKDIFIKIFIKKAWYGSTDEWHFVVGPRANNALIVTTILFRLMSPNVLAS